MSRAAIHRACDRGVFTVTRESNGHRKIERKSFMSWKTSLEAPTLTVSAAAQLSKRSCDTIRRACDLGEIACSRTETGERIIDRASVINWTAQRRRAKRKNVVTINPAVRVPQRRTSVTDFLTDCVMVLECHDRAIHTDEETLHLLRRLIIEQWERRNRDVEENADVGDDRAACEEARADRAEG
jgi:hypothetical protein